MPPYRIRADMQVNGGRRKLVLAALLQEKPEHLALKLAAYLLFWGDDLTVDPGSTHPALAGQEFRPDLLGTDVTGAVSLWIECGNTTTHKLLKVLRRWPQARVAVFKENPQQAERFRAMLADEVPRSERVEILAWPDGEFGAWMSSLSEKTDIIGEAGGLGFNLVVNEAICATDLIRR